MNEKCFDNQVNILLDILIDTRRNKLTKKKIVRYYLITEENIGYDIFRWKSQFVWIVYICWVWKGAARARAARTVS